MFLGVVDASGPPCPSSYPFKKDWNKIESEIKKQVLIKDSVNLNYFINFYYYVPIIFCNRKLQKNLKVKKL